MPSVSSKSPGGLLKVDGIVSQETGDSSKIEGCSHNRRVGEVSHCLKAMLNTLSDIERTLPDTEKKLSEREKIIVGQSSEKYPRWSCVLVSATLHLSSHH